MEPKPPNQMLGAYELLGVLAEGGMGSVHVARNVLTNEMRALKVIRENLASDGEFIERFLREVRLASAIEHRNLVRV